MRPSKTVDGTEVEISRAHLSRLSIEDFGLIARAELEFADGFTACTGETGSGKTMVLGALAFVLGGRASADDVRGGALRARAALEFDPDDALRGRFSADDFALDTGEPAIFVREVQSNGKSSARINGRAATAAQLRAYGRQLIESVGQHEHQRLLSPAYQLELLDAFGGDEARSLRARVAAGYERAAELASRLRELADESLRAKADLDDARFGLNDIDDGAPKAGEDETLRERRDVLMNSSRIAAALEAAHEALAGADGAAVEAVGAAAAAIATVARFSPALEALRETLAALQSDATDAATALTRERERVEFDADELDALTARLDRLDRLKKKYGGSIATVLAARSRFAQAVECAGRQDERERDLQAELDGTTRRLTEDAAALSHVRVRAARSLEAQITVELSALAMPAARFEVAVTALAEPGHNGSERVEFMLSPNPGEPVRPLSLSASGGELSRVLLAIAMVLADRRAGTALIFDEIDAGIGGSAARTVGQRIAAVAAHAQVVCVTHLAQIAAYAQRHYALRKRSDGDTTQIELVALPDDASVRDELARMLSGNATPAALRHAQTLLEASREPHCALEAPVAPVRDSSPQRRRKPNPRPARQGSSRAR